MDIETKSFVLALTTELLGTVPKDPTVYKTYIESKKPETNTEDESLTISSAEEKGWTGFHQDENGLFLYEYAIKGFLKQAGNILKESLAIKALRSKLDDYCFVLPRRLYLNKRQPDGVIERPIRVMTAQGPRVSLLRSDYVSAGTEITFAISLLKHKELTMKMIEDLLQYGALMGLGQFRNGGYGRFRVA